MSDTSVQIKASSARSKNNQAKNYRDVFSYPASENAAQNKKQATATDTVGKAEVTDKSSASAASNTAKKDTSKNASFMENIENSVKPYLDKHGHALAYGAVGLIAAILILTIGFWPVFLLALLAAIGIAIGKYRDGDVRMHAATKSLAGFFRK